MEQKPAARVFRALGLTYSGHTDAESTGAALGKFPKACQKCKAWLAIGGLRILRFRRRGNTPPRAYCVACALELGYVSHDARINAPKLPGALPPTKHPTQKRAAYEAWKASGGLGATLPAITTN